MKKAWYILNYHDISWEEGWFLRAIGGTFPPDVFAEHVATLAKSFKLVSVQDGMRALENGNISEPLLSFWFDDGFLGVRKYAYPILARAGIAGAISVNSSFMLRKELFWRVKMAHLAEIDGMRFVRARLRKLGLSFKEGTRHVVMDHFSDEILAVINEVFDEHTTSELRNDAWRLFDDVTGTRLLYDQGWVISNHSASHYPVSESSYVRNFATQFETCENELNEALGLKTDFWVMPFDRPPKRAPGLEKAFAQANSGDRRIVFVGNELNQKAELHRKKLFRVFVPFVPVKQLLKYLAKLQPHAG